MKNAAAFQATFSDFRLIKGRKVAQLIFELPIEGCDAALKAMGGVPQPHEERWAAIARIDLEVAQAVPQLSVVRQQLEASVELLDKSPKERRSWSALSYAEQAGIRCQEPAFWQFLKEDGQAQENNVHVSSSDEAADAVRVLCTVKSRADIKIGTDAGDYWLALNNDYESWLRRPTF